MNLIRCNYSQISSCGYKSLYIDTYLLDSWSLMFASLQLLGLIPSTYFMYVTYSSYKGNVPCSVLHVYNAVYIWCITSKDLSIATSQPEVLPTKVGKRLVGLGTTKMFFTTRTVFPFFLTPTNFLEVISSAMTQLQLRIRLHQ